MFDMKCTYDEIKRRDALAALEHEFPGTSCGNIECEKICSEVCGIAKKMNMEPKPLVVNAIRERVAPETQCIPANTDSVSPLVTSPCRFGFVNPMEQISLAESKYDVFHIFRAPGNSCEKCRACNGVGVSQEQMKNENFMKKIGFWKQKDGIFRPHPNCHCKWETIVIDYSKFDWQKQSSGKFAEYMVANLPFALKSIPAVLQRKLAKQVGLDVSEFDQWAQNIKLITNNRTYAITVDVPNIWICADLLRGGSWYWDISIVNWGGTIGQAISSIATWGMYEIKCKTVKELKEAFRNNRKAIWGFVLYAHGAKSGYIGPRVGNYQNKTAMNQNELISLVDAQRFKLAKLYLMQCYSGAEVEKKEVLFSYKKLIAYYYAEWRAGKMPSADYRKILSLNRSEFLKFSFPMVEKFSKDKCAQSSNRIFIRCEIYYSEIVTVYRENWGKEWGRHVVGGKPNISYKDLNVMGFDTNTFAF